MGTVASKYQRGGSRFWWVKFRDEGGVVRRQATKFRVGVAMDTRACAAHVASLTLQEKNRGLVARDAHAFERWTPEFLRVRYANSPRTLTKYEGSWRVLSRWLAGIGVTAPGHVRREFATQFMMWRTAQKVSWLKGKRLVCRNSALTDLTIFRLVMFEAMKRGYIAANPISKLGMKRDAAREKPELTPEQIATIRAALGGKPEWMRVSFEIAIHQGCRFAETCLPLERVNLRDGTITFRLKGGRMHTTKLHPALRPLFERMMAEGRKATFAMPSAMARDWSRFFKRIKMPGVSFHCTRVTCVTMLARAGVNEQQAMAYIGHSQSEIHRIYQRLRPRDLDLCVAAISPGSPMCESSDSPPAILAHERASSASQTGTSSQHVSSPTRRCARARSRQRAASS